MKSKTLKQFLAEKRKAYAQSAEAVMKTLDTLTHVRGNAYNGSAVIINITDLEGKFWPTRPSTASSWKIYVWRSLRRIARR